MKGIEDVVYPLLRIYEKLPKFVRWTFAKMYLAIPQKSRLGASYFEFTDLLKDTEFKSIEDLKVYQNKAFLECIEVAKKTDFYPWYYKEHGIDINSITSINDITKLPFIEKATLQKEGKNLIDKSREGDSLYITTGGSSGTPTGLYYEKGVTRGKEQAFIEKIWNEVGYNLGDKSASLRGKVTSRGDSDQIYKYDFVRNWLHLSSYHLAEETVEFYIKELNSFKPKFLQGYPSALTLFAKIMLRKNLKLNFKLEGILAGSENISNEQIDIIEKALDTKLITWYGHSEVAVLGGFFKGDRNYHLFPQYGVTELVDKDDNVILEGKGEIVGTNFHNGVFPLIRYKTGDIAVYASSPNYSSGRFYKQLSSIEGRDHEFIVGERNRLISLTAINMHDKTFDNVKQYQFVQDEPNKVELKYSLVSSSEEIDESSILMSLREKLGTTMDIKLTLVDDIPLSKRGKQVALVQNIDVSLIIQ